MKILVIECVAGDVARCMVMIDFFVCTSFDVWIGGNEKEERNQTDKVVYKCVEGIATAFSLLGSFDLTTSAMSSF